LLLQLSDDLAYGIHSLRTRAEIAKQAWHDSLTGLPNRSLLRDRMRQAMASAKRTGRILAVLFLDLDGFKQINDQYGHAAGDDLIREIAARLVSSVRAGDTVARLGGDEFVILLDVASHEEMGQCLDRIMAEVMNPVPMDGHAVSVSASIGVTLFPQNDADADALLRHADMAMYQAKQAGRNCYRIFDVNMDQSARLSFQMRERIAQAIEARGFCLYYQPKVNLGTGEIFGVEALIRWNHPERGLLPPLDFLPFAENSELIIRLGDWVLDEALRQLSIWKEEGIDIGVSVNVASEQLHEPGFCQKVKGAISRYGNLEPACLELEILESTALKDIQLVKKVLGDCKALGVMLSLDDFGTGYSSLAYLRHLPVDILKIDQSFVRDMIDDREDLATIEGVISLAKIFKRDLIAEGVETIEHGRLLLQLGCERGQGYGIAKPMRAEDLPGWVKSRQASG
ncbi:MAG TPA: EAL domain-containing protein, partial [Burkholderiales bacterium]|nr:EAL domain-containing protein [Burkholderiales bacterium]